MRRSTRVLMFTALLICAVGGAPGCDKDESDGQAPESAAESDSDGARSDWPDKVVFAFQPQENPGSIRPDANKIRDYMSDKLGVETEVFLPTSYAAVVEGLRSKNADVAYFSGWPYLIADQKVGMDLLVVEERDGNPFYKSRVYVTDDSDIESLADLKGRSIAFTSATSTCGYLFPMAEIIKTTDLTSEDEPKSFFSDVLYAGGYQQALQSLLRGRVEAAAASDYAPELYLSDKERDRIRVLSEQGPVPTHGVAVRSALPDNLKDRIKRAFLGLNDAEHAELLESLYGAEKLVERSHDDHVGAMARALEVTGEERGIEGFGAGSGSGHGHSEGSGSGHEDGDGSGSAHGHSDEGGEGSGSGDSHGSEAGSGAGSGHDHE